MIVQACWANLTGTGSRAGHAMANGPQYKQRLLQCLQQIKSCYDVLLRHTNMSSVHDSQERLRCLEDRVNEGEWFPLSQTQ
jgi:hypothetical protein